MSCAVVVWALSGLVATAYIFLGFWTRPSACFNMTQPEYQVLKESYWITGGSAFLLVALAAVRFISVKLNFIHTAQKRKLTEAAFRESFKERLSDPRSIQREVKVQGVESIWVACAAAIPAVTTYLESALHPFVGRGVFTTARASACWYSAVGFAGVSILATLSLMIGLSVLYFASIRKRVLDVEYVPLKDFEECVDPLIKQIPTAPPPPSHPYAPTELSECE